MVGMLGFIAGGALEGTGQGMIAEGKAKKEEFLRRLEHQNRLELTNIREKGASERQERNIEATDARAARTSAAADARSERQINARLNELNLRLKAEGDQVVKTEPDKDGNIYAITRNGRTIDVGIQGRPSASNKDTARMTEAQWLVDKGLYKDLQSAYQATREKVGLSDQDKRAKAISWVTSQKNAYGEPKYSTPEQQNAAIDAYMRWVDGDSEGAMAALRALEPDKKTDEPGMLESLWRSLPFVGGKTKSTEPAVNLEMPTPGPRSGNVPGGGQSTPAVPYSRPEAPESKPEPSKSMPQPSGDSATPRPQAPEARAPQPRQPEAPEVDAPPPTLQGSGSRNNPFVPRTQADIEWFKQHAPKGTFLLGADGKTLYPKR